MLGANPAQTDSKGSHTKPGTHSRDPGTGGAPKAERLIPKSWKGPDAPERGRKGASHNGKATDYLKSNPCLPAAPEGPESHAGRTLRGHPGQSRGTGTEAGRDNEAGVSRAQRGCEAATSAGEGPRPCWGGRGERGPG